MKIYIDPAGVSHEAMVTATNPMNEDVLDLVYVDPKEGIKQVFGIHHIGHDSKKEPNPELPDYQLNAWKNPGEDHNQLPADHPGNDHPFATKEQKDRVKGIAPKPPIQAPDVTVEQQPVTEKEPDVIAELETAGPAPAEPEPKKEAEPDQA